MLIFRYCLFLLPLAVVFWCFSCTSTTPEIPVTSAVDSLAQRLDSIGWEPYAQSLIINGELKNYELLDSCIQKDEAFYKDSLYLAMQESDWAFFGIDWFYSNKGSTFSTYPINKEETGICVLNHLFDSSEYSYKFSKNELAQLKAVLDSIKVIAPDIYYTQNVLVCSKLALVYYDGRKFYYLENRYGQPTKEFISHLGTILNKYYNQGKYKKRR